MKKRIYLDDVRTPTQGNWVLVKTYEEFIDKVKEVGFDNIDYVSLDHDLGDEAIMEYHTNVAPNFKLDYNNIKEKTGLDAAKWLVEQWMNGNSIFKVLTHSANPIGSANIIGYINNYLKNIEHEQTCVRVRIPSIILNKN